MESGSAENALKRLNFFKVKEKYGDRMLIRSKDEELCKLLVKYTYFI